MEYVYIYAKNKFSFSANQPYDQYDISKFLYSIKEMSEGNDIVLGGKKVTVFKSGDWTITKNASGNIKLLK